MRSWLGAHRAILVLAGFLLIGALVGQVVSERVSDREEPKLTSTDAQRDGALALALLVERLGYRVQRLDHSSDALDGSAGALFVLWPVRPFEEAETSGLVNWVESGGVLVYLPAPGLAATGIGQGSQDALSRQLEIRLTPVPWTESARSTPGLMPAESVFAVASSWALELGNDAWVPLLAEEGRVFGAARGLGTGRVYVASSDALFANQSIATDANATFAVHAVAQIPRSKSVVFEESHHAPSAAQNLTSAARTSPWGWAIGYTALMSFFFALWGGRRFGPPIAAVPSPARSSGEYVTALAGLLQRARATTWIQKRYAAQVRRRIAHLIGVRADLPSRALADLLAQRNPVDASRLAEDLEVLGSGALSEGALLDRAREIERMLSLERR
ncbi:MAG TPA: DUF4350 domain-containing protein [Chloroflexota bacterium]|nr:DUF4350 domain-containing protein [Chloroflexota bacterium]